MITTVAAYAAGMLSLSRGYVVPTYMVLGLATAYIRLASIHRPSAVLPFNGRLVLGLVLVSTVSLVGIYVFVRIYVQYG